MKRIEITVSPAGQTEVTTTGFTGDECRAASRFLEQALGEALHERLTAEFHERRSTEQSLHERS